MSEQPWKDGLASLLTWEVIAGTVIATSPVTSYFDTLLSIHRRKSSAGFSLDVCAIMLVSSICRIYFYFGRPYEMSLFLQSVIMVAIQLALLRAALLYRPVEKATIGPLDTGTLHPLPESGAQEHAADGTGSTVVGARPGGVSSRFGGLKHWLSRLLLGPMATIRHGQSRRPYAFWEWKDQALYWAFLLRLCLWLGIAQVLLGNVPLYVDMLGLFGLLVEAVLPLPQILTTAAEGSVDGLRPSLLLSWLGGDVSKFAFLATAENVSPQFFICTAIQTVLDLVVALQYYMYSTGKWKGKAHQEVRTSRQRAQSLKAQGITSD